MIEKIFGKKKTLQRSFALVFTISIIFLTIASGMFFYFFVHHSINDKLVQVSVRRVEDVQEILRIAKNGFYILLTNIILISVVIIGFITKKMLSPIKKITEATKRVAQGDFTVELETKRDDEIGELTNNFNKMVKELNSIECIQKDFINNVSHEIKTPITSIQGFARLLKDEDITEEERREYSDIIVEETDRLLKLTTNILKLSKLQNQERLTKKEEVLISEQIRKAISILEPKWKEKNLKFNISLQEKYFLGDEDLIFQIWLNLIDNAIKFSNDNGYIDINMKIKNNYIVTEIRDYGIGMDENQKSKIFERFYQIDKSHSENGSGLGLAIVKRIVELSNGKIEVDSKKGEGTSFIVCLPLEEKENKIIIK